MSDDMVHPAHRPGQCSMDSGVRPIATPIQHCLHPHSTSESVIRRYDVKLSHEHNIVHKRKWSQLPVVVGESRDRASGPKWQVWMKDVTFTFLTRTCNTPTDDSFHFDRGWGLTATAIGRKLHPNDSKVPTFETGEYGWAKSMTLSRGN